MTCFAAVMCPGDGLLIYLANMFVIVDRSGLVPWESHRSEPTRLLICFVNFVLSSSCISTCGTLSTGCPDLYGVGLEDTASPPNPADWISCSANAC